jgi:hypothetical protein
MKLVRKAGHLKGVFPLKSKNPFRDFGRDFIDSRFKIYGLKLVVSSYLQVPVLIPVSENPPYPL